MPSAAADIAAVDRLAQKSAATRFQQRPQRIATDGVSKNATARRISGRRKEGRNSG